jgi:hypothetical protein
MRRAHVVALIAAAAVLACAQAAAAQAVLSGCASDADVNKLRIAMTALTDEISALRLRVLALGGGYAATEAAALKIDVSRPQAGCTSKAELEALQKRFVFDEDELAALAVRVTDLEIRSFEPSSESSDVNRLSIGGN